MTKKSILVWVRSPEEDKHKEALRAAVGLCLRGAAVSVHFSSEFSENIITSRAAKTLADLGIPLPPPSNAAPPSYTSADIVEVW